MHCLFTFCGLVVSLVEHSFSATVAKESLHPWVKVDRASRPLPPKRLSILEGLMLNLVHTLCCSLLNCNDLDFWVDGLDRFVLAVISQSLLDLKKI